MATKKSKKKESHTGLGVAAVAAVVAVAGVAFLYGSDQGKQVKKKVKGWSLKAKGEILEKLESAKDISDESYQKIVDGVLAKYTKLKKVESKEIESLLREMKGHWRTIKKEVSAGVKDTKKTVKRTKKTVTTAKKKPATKKKTTRKPAKKTVKKKAPAKKVAKRKTTKKK